MCWPGTRTVLMLFLCPTHLRWAASHLQPEAVGSVWGPAGEVWVAAGPGGSVQRLPADHVGTAARPAGDGSNVSAARLAAHINTLTHTHCTDRWTHKHTRDNNTLWLRSVRSVEFRCCRKLPPPVSDWISRWSQTSCWLTASNTSEPCVVLSPGSQLTFCLFGHRLYGPQIFSGLVNSLSLQSNPSRQLWAAGTDASCAFPASHRLKTWLNGFKSEGPQCSSTPPIFYWSDRLVLCFKEKRLRIFFRQK